MRVGIDKRYIDSYKKIVKEANKILRNKRKPALQKDNYKKVLLNQNISVEKKKKQLIKILHGRILHTFSIDIQKANKTLESTKKQTAIIREIIHKIKSINNYLEESFLKEIGFIKKSITIRAIQSKKPEKYLQQARGLPKNYIGKIEHTVVLLMQEIVFFDKKLLRNYSKKQTAIIQKEKIEVKDLEKTLKAESEIVDVLEEKIPPARRVQAKLFKKEIFNKWVPMVFALLSSLEEEYDKEEMIFSKIKKKSR